MRAHRAVLAIATPLPVPAGFAEFIAGRAELAGYHAVGSEADPSALVAFAAGAGCAICYPHVVSREATLRFLRQGDSGPVAGPFGLRQPRADGAEVVPDVVLVPLLSFDRRLHRLGQGAGHYDRALVASTALRIGVAYAGQQVDALPVDPWDQPLDVVVTERGLHWPEETA